MPTANIIERAVETQGTQLKLARLLGITRSAIAQWKKVPPGRVLDVERITGISRHDLRPDVFGPKPKDIADGSGRSVRRRRKSS